MQQYIINLNFCSMKSNQNHFLFHRLSIHQGLSFAVSEKVTNLIPLFIFSHILHQISLPVNLLNFCSLFHRKEPFAIFLLHLIPVYLLKILQYLPNSLSSVQSLNLQRLARVYCDIYKIQITFMIKLGILIP